jgi:hypothetical protein
MLRVRWAHLTAAADLDALAAVIAEAGLPPAQVYVFHSSSANLGISSREYLIIQPLAPEAAGPVIARAADAVRVLDDLGLVVRLV